MFMNARDDEQLKKLSDSLKPILVAKCDALDKLIEENKHAEVKVSEKTARFWEMKRVATSMILDVLEDGEKPTSEVNDEAKGKRGEYFKAAAQAWAGLKDVLVQLSKEVIGPYALGTLYSLMDDCAVSTSVRRPIIDRRSSPCGLACPYCHAVRCAGYR